MKNKQTEFLKKIKSSMPELQAKKQTKKSGTRKRCEREEMDLQKELERRFEELFGSLDDDD